ncbi:hypothetical protein K435DRAFT_290870 [Dendrothele bispora CBS 962.96]|uniref:Zn(2)-C6 fungal-type domain-containing protein n=1 Tax=Dendrothele bispora (strain CBS 962.96) TaxID=1314807 RepID=A0A4S8LJN4_DENBC|nr:hypothetical protein K435DRAFT_290870 [Dendrothele bispora CBS 962.96]
MNPQSQKGSQKEKKKRRRLRLNCVECTDRHQRCDRKKPCTPCSRRGVSHLCRWEKEPYARPTPSRPPSHLGSDSDEKAELKKQVASLERQLDLLLQVASPEQRLMLQASHTGCETESSVSDLDRFSTASRYSPTPSSVGSTYPLHTDETPTTRRMSGTIYSNLPYASEHPDNLFGQGSSMDYLHAPNGGWQAGGIVCPSIGSDHALVGSDWFQQSASSIEELLSFIPPKDEIQSRSNTFFSKNWFGIPRGYFDAGVEHMFSCHQSGRNVDPNLLALLFAILGYASSVDTRLQPTGFEHSDRYFSFSNFALLIASVGESTYCSEYQTTNTSTFDKHQALLGCFCVPILCDHYVKRGRFEAAWALIDRWIQIAQAILHREDDPHGRIALWNLVAFDKIYCVALDKPSSNSCSLSTDSALEALEEDKYRLALYSLSNIASDVSEKVGSHTEQVSCIILIFISIRSAWVPLCRP